MNMEQAAKYLAERMAEELRFSFFLKREDAMDMAEAMSIATNRTWIVSNHVDTPVGSSEPQIYYVVVQS